MGEPKELIQGTDTRGRKVTMAEDGKGGVYLSDGHIEQRDYNKFFGKKKGHDHYDNKGGGTQRGKYTG